MQSRLLRIAIAVAAGLAAPWVELAIRCRTPHPATRVATEMCVWTRAYLPLAAPIYLVFYGLVTYAGLSLVAAAVRKRRFAA